MLCALPIAALLAAGAPSGGEPPDTREERSWSLDLTIDDFGIGIGNSRMPRSTAVPPIPTSSARSRS